MFNRMLSFAFCDSNWKVSHNTGVYGNKNNLRNAPLAKDLLTMPQYFSKHGYHTLTRGKIFRVHPSDEGTPAAIRDSGHLMNGPMQKDGYRH